MIENVKLGTQVEFQRGYDLTHNEMQDGPYPVVGSTSIIGYHDQAKAEDGITLGRSGTVGIPQLIRGPYWPHNTSLFTTDLKGNDLEYLYYLLINLHIDKMKTGSNIPTLNRNDIYPLTIPFETSVFEQRKISHVLSSLDDKIRNNTDICSELDSMENLLNSYWFLQYDFPDEDGKPYKSSGGKMVENKQLKRSIPKGWEVTRLGDRFTTDRGISYSTHNIESGEGVPMINLACFMPGGGAYKPTGIKHFLGEYPAAKVIQPYDLLMCNTQQTAIKFETDIIGRAMLAPDIFDEDMVSSHHVNVIRPDDDYLKYYLLFLFNSDYFHKYISGFTNGTNILGLSFNGVEDYVTELPPKELLQKFADIIKPIEEKKSRIIKENQELTELRDFLLPLLMNGQVKVAPQGETP